MPTLSSPEILLDVVRAFRQSIPAVNLLGRNFSQSPLRFNKPYTAHVAGVATTQAVTSTYAVSGNNARDLLYDIPVTVDRRFGTRLFWENLLAIQDDKFEYDEVIRAAGYSLAKTMVDDLLATARAEFFSQRTVIAAADSDVDMLALVTSSMNNVGANPRGRVMFCNSAVASALAADSRLGSKDFAGQLQGEEGYRSWERVHGFRLIQEYPSLPTNNGTAITGGAITASSDVYAKTAHGLVTGQRVILTSLTGGTGLTAGTAYFFIRTDANNGFIASTLANALAGTRIDVTLDASSVVLTPTENISAFATDATGICFLAGPEDHAGQEAMAESLGIPRVMAFDTVTDPDSGISMSAVKYQDAGTGNLTWMPLLLWGRQAGRQLNTNAIGSFTDYGGHLVSTS
jgi:hypothetical protein